MTDLPLSLRVSAPVDNWPARLDGIEWRPLVLDDIDAVVAMNRSIAAADHPNWAETREETLEELSHSWVDLKLDSMGAITDRGELVAWGLVIFPPSQDTLVRSILAGGVDPAQRGRGIGSALLNWQRSRAEQQLASSTKTLPGWIVVSADERSASSGRLAKRSGFTPTRWFHSMSRAIEQDSIPQAAPLDGFRIVRFAHEHSAAAHEVRDEAFRGHGSSQPMDDEQWDSMTTMSTAAPEFSFVAIDPQGRVVALLLALVTREDWPLQGYSSAYVWTLGVAPQWRDRGIATALITAHLRALSDATIERSVLDVASDGAGQRLGLFTSAGYEEQSRSVNYIRIY